jgi:Tfp pilus assembly protein PilO
MALEAEQETQRAAADVVQVVQQIERFRERLSPTNDTSWLLNEVVKIADVSGVQLTRIAPETPKAVGPFTHLAVSLQFTASYHQLGSFLNQVESGRPFLRVESLKVSKAASDGPDGSAASVSLVLSTLYAASPLSPVEAGGLAGLSPVSQ